MAGKPAAEGCLTKPVDLGGRKLVQVALTVRDLDRARVFYRDTLGLPLLFEAPPSMMFFDLAGLRLLVGKEEQPGSSIGGSPASTSTRPTSTRLALPWRRRASYSSGAPRRCSAPRPMS